MCQTQQIIFLANKTILTLLSYLKILQKHRIISGQKIVIKQAAIEIVINGQRGIFRDYTHCSAQMIRTAMYVCQVE